MMGQLWQTPTVQAGRSRDNYYDFYGAPRGGGTLFSTHVGDGIALFGFQEGEDDLPGESAAATMARPSTSLQLVGFVLLILFLLYLDKRVTLEL